MGLRKATLARCDIHHHQRMHLGRKAERQHHRGLSPHRMPHHGGGQCVMGGQCFAYVRRKDRVVHRAMRAGAMIAQVQRQRTAVCSNAALEKAEIACPSEQPMQEYDGRLGQVAVFRAKFDGVEQHGIVGSGSFPEISGYIRGIGSSPPFIILWGGSHAHSRNTCPVALHSDAGQTQLFLFVKK